MAFQQGAFQQGAFQMPATVQEDTTQKYVLVRHGQRVYAEWIKKG